MYNLIVATAYPERVLNKYQKATTMRLFLIRGLTIPVIFLLSIGISFFSVSAAVWSWLVMIAADAVIAHRRLAR